MADAVVIAAVSDLLAALEATLPIICSTYLPAHNGKVDPEFGKQVLETKTLVFAAIAKARGLTAA